MSHRVWIVAALFAALTGVPAFAELREMSQAELRQSVESGRSQPLSRINGRLARQIDGQLVSARAYDDGRVYYWLLLKTANGKLASAVVDARTGQIMSSREKISQDIRRAAQGGGSGSFFRSSKSSRNPFDANDPNTPNRDNGNAGGNSNAGGNGNSGGNGNAGGNGNSGGNGGGNANAKGNGSGNGNAGSNAGGNGKGSGNSNRGGNSGGNGNGGGNGKGGGKK